MAISPSEAAKKLLESNKEAIEKEEQKIDAALILGNRVSGVRELTIEEFYAL